MCTLETTFLVRSFFTNMYALGWPGGSRPCQVAWSPSVDSFPYTLVFTKLALLCLLYLLNLLRLFIFIPHLLYFVWLCIGLFACFFFTFLIAPELWSGQVLEPATLPFFYYAFLSTVTPVLFTGFINALFFYRLGNCITCRDYLSLRKYLYIVLCMCTSAKMLGMLLGIENNDWFTLLTSYFFYSRYLIYLLHLHYLYLVYFLFSYSVYLI